MSDVDDTLAMFATELGQACLPMQLALQTPQSFQVFMRELGWNMPSIPAPLQALLAPLGELADLLDQDSFDLAQLPQLIGNITAFIDAVNDIASAPSGAFPGTVNATEFKNEFPDQLLQFLIVEYLLNTQKNTGTILLLLGVIRLIPVATSGLRPAYLRREIAWNDLGQLFQDPAVLFRNTYKWGQNDFKGDILVQHVNEVASAFGVDTRVEKPKPQIISYLTQGATAETPTGNRALLLIILEGEPVDGLHLEGGIGLFILPPTASDKPGFALLPYAEGDFGKEISLSENVSLTIEASFDVAGGVAILVRADKPIEVRNDLLSGGTPPAAGSIGVGVIGKGAGGEPIVLFSSSLGRIEVGRVSLMGGARVDSSGKAEAFLEAALQNARLLIQPGGSADSFVTTLLPGGGFAVEFSLTAGLGSNTGFYFSGSGGLEILLPAHIQLGPINIDSALIALKFQDSGEIDTDLAASFTGLLGPLTAVVENMGVRLALTFPASGGNLGPANLEPRFLPPNGVGLSINAGVVIGGGYLFFDFDKQEYAGVLELTLAGFISIKAIGLITTRMPDGSQGFSMLLILTAEFNPPFQLSFGFTLNAVGGLLGLNRTMLLDPLREGVRTGAVNSIMFPQNVVANAQRIISDLKAIFPPFPDIFLIGPMVKAGWGTPSLVTLSLGIIIEIPGNIAILGVLRVALPTEEAALINLQVNFVGTIDFDKEMVTFDASLYESRVLFMTIEGDMAVRVKWGDDANFLLSVGGFHPSYQPPPLSLPVMRRLAISILNTSVARIRVEGYFAVTSNTVQFGARAEMMFGFDEFKVEGYIGFDALFQFSPFYFIIEISAGLTLVVFGIDALSIRLRFALSGPTPWQAKGTGSVSILFWDIDVDFDITWGEERNTTLPDIQVMPRLLEEVNKADQWRALLPEQSHLLVSLRNLEAAASTLVLHPTGALQVVQKFIPLDFTFEKIGGQKPADVKRVSIPSATSGATAFSLAAVDESFAPAQYKNMSNAEKLSARSFDKLAGGVTLIAGALLRGGKMVKRSIAYELTIIDKEPHKPYEFGRFFKLSGVLFSRLLGGNAVKKSTLSQQVKTQLQPFADKVKVQEEGYSVAFTMDNRIYESTAVFHSEAQAKDYLQRQNAADPKLGDQLHVISNFEVNHS